MKKVASIILSFVLILIISSPLPVSAQQVTADSNNYDESITEIIREVPCTSDMLKKAQEMNILPENVSLVTPYATCKHLYSSWVTIKTWKEKPTGIGKCCTLYRFQMRYCKKCNAAFAREKVTQEEHRVVVSGTSWRCTECGERGYLL
jgi:hypothetical protein